MKNFRTLAKIFQQGCQNYILRVQRNVLVTIFFKFFFNFIRTLSKKLSAGMLKLHSTCDWEHFLVNDFKREHSHSELENSRAKI